MDTSLETPQHYLEKFIESIKAVAETLMGDAECITQRFQVVGPEHLAMMHPSAERWGKVTADLQNLADIFVAFKRNQIDAESLKIQMNDIFGCVDVDIRY